MKPLAESEDLCRACGFCCDWVLFRFAELSADEAAWAKRRHLPLVDRAGKASLAIPCGAHGRAGCTVYEERPSVCRSFRCVLLRGVADGQTPFEKASALVTRARALADRIADQLQATSDVSAVAGLDELARLASEGQLKQLSPALLLDIGELRMILRRSFLLPKQA